MKKYTIKELQEKSLRTLIHCTPEQAKKLGKYYFYKDEKKSINLEIWQAYNCFQAYKRLVVFIGYCSKYKHTGGWNNINHDYKPDIEFEQVIFPEDEKEKIIIGYKWKSGFEIYEKAVLIISKDLDSLNLFEKEGQLINLTNNSILKLKLEKEEVLDKWFEPVYELSKPKFEKIELGTPKRKFTIYKDKIEIITGSNKSEEFDNRHLSTLDNCLGKVLYKIDNYDLKVSSVQIGCEHGIELRKEDLEKIKQIQNDL